MAQAAKETSAMRQALAAIRFFEKEGREVVGISIKGKEYHLDFAPSGEPDVSDADLINMGK